MSPTPVARTACPSEVELSAFADGRLGEPHLSSIGEHLTRCRQCEETLQRVASESSLVELLQLAEVNSLAQEPECLRMQQAAREMPRRAGLPAEDLSQESTDTSRLSTVNGPADLARPGSDDPTIAVGAFPATVGRYRIQSILGEGSYGRVYLAIDPELDRKVALKVPKFASQLGAKTGGPLVEALLREARTAARLKHPGIVTIYDVGYDDEAGCYVAMEFVEGQSLKHVIAAGRVSHEQAAKWVAQAAEAVHYAHKQGLVHRDLKPANLLIDADGNVKVADFGLAIFEEQQRSRAGEFAGTLAYCSPEQIRGEVHHLDGRTDIYSLGVILYELLTGRRPFGGPNLADEILHRPPKPPRQIDDTIPEALEEICLKCLSKETVARYPTASDVVKSIRGFPRDRTQAPVKDKPPRGSRRYLFAGVALAIVLIAGLAAAIYPRPIPYLVDSVATPFKPIRLLTREPRVLFSPSRSTETIVVNTPEEKVFVNASHGLLLGLGKTRSTSFQLSVNISEDNSAGETGIFLGYQPARDQDGKQCWAMEMISLHAFADGKYFIQRRRMLIVPGGGAFSPRDMWSINEPVAAAEIRDATLEVTVRNNLITEIRWMDRKLSKLVGRKIPDPLPAYQGEFGVIAVQQAAWFKGAEFRMLPTTPE